MSNPDEPGYNPASPPYRGGSAERETLERHVASRLRRARTYQAVGGAMLGSSAALITAYLFGVGEMPIPSLGVALGIGGVLMLMNANEARHDAALSQRRLELLDGIVPSWFEGRDKS